MNKYYKYFPNVYLAQCTEKHGKGEIIEIETKYGKINEHVIFNLVFEKNGFYFYSILRTDGFNKQTRLEKKIEKLENCANNQNKKKDEYYKKSNKHSEFLSLGEPVKVGHHSEKKHRKILEDADRNMQKSFECSEKAKEYKEKSERLEKHLEDIDLSIPESIEYFKNKLAEATEKYETLKKNPEKREHQYSLAYAKKSVNDLNKKLEIAIKLWGTK